MGTTSENEEEKGKTWPQYLAVFIAIFAMFVSGIHYGWPSPSIPILLSDDYPLNITAEEASYVTISGPAGGILGSILYPTIVDCIGRKYTIILIAVPQILSMVLIHLSTYSVTLLYIARIIGGSAEAACFTIIPLYIGEIAEPKVRGLLGSYFSLFFIFGILVINLVGSYFTIQTCSLVFSILPILFIICFLNMPESPYYLIMKSKIADAERSLKFLRRKQNVEKELTQLKNDVKRQMSESGSYKDLYQIQSNRKAFIIMFSMRLIQQLSGVSAFTLYMQTLFEKSTDFIPKHYASVIIFALELAAVFVSTLIVDKVGRRPLLMVSSLGCCSVLVLQGVYYVLKYYTTVDLTSVSFLPLIGIIVFIVSFALGLGNIVNVMIGEMFSASVKAKASCILNIWYAVIIMISTKFFQFTSDRFSLAVPFLCFAVCELLGFFFCYLYVPETSGKSLEEIQQELKGKKDVEN